MFVFKDREKIPTIKKDLLQLLEKVIYAKVYMTKTDQINVGTLAIQSIWGCVDAFDVAYSCSDSTKREHVLELYNKFGSFISLFQIMQRRHVIKEKKNHVDLKQNEINTPKPESYELELFRLIGETDDKITNWKKKYEERKGNLPARTAANEELPTDPNLM